MRLVANEQSSGHAIMQTAPSVRARFMFTFSFWNRLPQMGMEMTMEIAWVVSMNVKSPRLQPRASVTGSTYTLMIELIRAIEPANMKQQATRMNHA